MEKDNIENRKIALSKLKHYKNYNKILYQSDVCCLPWNIHGNSSALRHILWCRCRYCGRSVDKIEKINLLIAKFNLYPFVAFSEACIRQEIEIAKYMKNNYKFDLRLNSCLEKCVVNHLFIKKSIEYLIYLGADPFLIRENFCDLVIKKKEFVKKELLNEFGDPGNIIYEYL